MFTRERGDVIGEWKNNLTKFHPLLADERSVRYKVCIEQLTVTHLVKKLRAFVVPKCSSLFHVVSTVR